MYYYDENGRITSFSLNNKMYFYLYDVNGEIYGIINETGVLEGMYLYSPFGELL